MNEEVNTSFDVHNFVWPRKYWPGHLVYRWFVYFRNKISSKTFLWKLSKFYLKYFCQQSCWPLVVYTAIVASVCLVSSDVCFFLWRHDRSPKGHVNILQCIYTVVTHWLLPHWNSVIHHHHHHRNHHTHHHLTTIVTILSYGYLIFQEHYQCQTTILHVTFY